MLIPPKHAGKERLNLTAAAAEAGSGDPWQTIEVGFGDGFMALQGGKEPVECSWLEKFAPDRTWLGDSCHNWHLGKTRRKDAGHARARSAFRTRVP